MKSVYQLKSIETERLLLRPLCVGDAEKLHKVVGKNLKLLNMFLANFSHDGSFLDTQKYVQQAHFAWQSGYITKLRLVVIRKSDGYMLGVSSMLRLDDNHKHYEISYWFDKSCQGYGYAQESINAMVHYIFRELMASKVIAEVAVFNNRSIALLNRLNFVREDGEFSCKDFPNRKNYHFYCDSADRLQPTEASWSYYENMSSEAQAIAWARDVLEIHSDHDFSKSRFILQTPWSSVMQIHTGKEVFYLKQMPDQLALEAKIFQRLRQQFNAPVPEVIAVNENLYSFLMKDAGFVLRGLLKQKFDVDLLCVGIDQFTKLQLAVSEDIGSLLAIGVPDWRLMRLTELLAELLAQKDLLMLDGLSEQAWIALQSSLPKIDSLCKQLATYPIKDSLCQPDFQDNNMVFDEKTNRITHIDLGEVVISHPFFSLVGCLAQMHKHYQLTIKDADFIQIQDACFKRFVSLDDEHKMDVLQLARSLWPVYDALSQYRLMKACGRDLILQSQPGRLTRSLQILLENIRK